MENDTDADVLERDAPSAEEPSTDSGDGGRITELEATVNEQAGALERLRVERDDLAAKLDDAKRQFANAFLSSPEHARAVQADDVRKDGEAMTFEQLFKGRNEYNAN